MGGQGTKAWSLPNPGCLAASPHQHPSQECQSVLTGGVQNTYREGPFRARNVGLKVWERSASSSLSLTQPMCTTCRGKAWKLEALTSVHCHRGSQTATKHVILPRPQHTKAAAWGGGAGGPGPSPDEAADMSLWHPAETSRVCYRARLHTCAADHFWCGQCWPLSDIQLVPSKYLVQHRISFSSISVCVTHLSVSGKSN